MDNIEVLEKIGLKKAEAKIYLSLLQLKESKTGPLCEHANIPSSNVYLILDSLIEKGFVSYRIQNNVKIFIPANPEILDNLFDEKHNKIEQERKEIKELISNLKAEQSISLPISNYRYYEGLQGVKSLWFELIEGLKDLPKDSTIKIYSSPLATLQQLMPIYNEFHKVRVKLKLKYRLILSDKDKQHGEKRKKLPYTEVKYATLNNEAEISILGNNLILQYNITKNPRAFLIQDEIFVKTFEQIFDSLWNNK